MKAEIVPAILAKTKKEFFDKLEIASQFAKTVQIDLMDGLFVDNKSSRDLLNGNWFAEYLLAHPDCKLPRIELHLMVMDPWRVVTYWVRFEQIYRVIWHVEAPLQQGDLIQAIHALKIQAGLAINPKTSVSELTPLMSATKNKASVDHVLVMGVTPGWSGQRFKPSVLAKIKSLRRKYPKLSIGIDGGVSLNNAKEIIRSGANILNAAGAIFLAENPKQAYKELSKIK